MIQLKPAAPLQLPTAASVGDVGSAFVVLRRVGFGESTALGVGPPAGSQPGETFHT